MDELIEEEMVVLDSHEVVPTCDLSSDLYKTVVLKNGKEISFNVEVQPGQGPGH